MQRQQQERSKELPEARVARSRARHGSLRQLHQAAADALSRRLNSARLSLTRQRSVTSADDEASTSTMTSAAAGADAAAVFYDPTSPTSPRPAAAATFSLSGSRRRLSRSPQQLSGPAATSAALSNSKFQLLSPMSQTDRLNSLVHQRSNESHDSTTSGVSMMSVRSSLHSDREFKMDLMNFKKQDSLGCDEAGAPEYSYAAFSSGAAAGAGPGGVGASGSGASGGAGAFISSTGVGGAAKQDEPSVKGLWRRAFNKLKTKDKDKGKKKRSCKDDEDIADVDPVYSLLKRAADKGVQKCSGCSGPTSGTSPRASDASLFSTSPVSLSSTWLPPPSPQLPPCDPVTCECLCHRAQLIPCITLNDLKPQSKHHHSQHHQFHYRPKARSRSLTADVESQGEMDQQQQQQQKRKKQFKKQQSEDEALPPQQPVWGGRGRISATFETRWSRDLQPQSLPE